MVQDERGERRSGYKITTKESVPLQCNFYKKGIFELLNRLIEDRRL